MYVINVMDANPDYFVSPESRRAFCFDYHFLPVLDTRSQPSLESFDPLTQFFCAADYRREAWVQYRQTHVLPRRKAANLKPTAFIYECDTLPLDAQQKNIRAEALPHILSVTYSGGKSLHVAVPIPDAIAEAIIDRDLDEARKVYRRLWGLVAEQCFIDPDRLDKACATIGRLSRLPGVVRYPAANGRIDTSANSPALPLQQCLFLNGNGEYIDFEPLLDEVVSGIADEERERERNIVLYAMRDMFRDFGDYGDALEHLRNSQAKWPNSKKRLALRVLDGGDIPSQSLLEDGLSYISVVGYLKKQFPQLAEEFVGKVKAAHPTNLPRDIEEYLVDDDEDDEDADANDGADEDECDSAEVKAVV